MNKQNLQTRRSISDTSHGEVHGTFVELEGESFYKISNCHRMPEFFMSLTSASDHWMFISSCGALSAGRCDSDHVLFPYYSADRISDLRHCTGSLTLIRVVAEGKNLIWEPFADNPQSSVQRNIYKNSLGNKIVFEEVHQSLGIQFRYSWSFSHQFGFVRHCELVNVGTTTLQLEVLDGIQNIMPFGIGENFQQRFSNLGDAYKKNELVDHSVIALYYLSSIPSDRAEPSEGLRSTAVWQYPAPMEIMISSEQVERFKNGQSVTTEKRHPWQTRSLSGLEENAVELWREV